MKKEEEEEESDWVSSPWEASRREKHRHRKRNYNLLGLSSTTERYNKLRRGMDEFV